MCVCITQCMCSKEIQFKFEFEYENSYAHALTYDLRFTQLKIKIINLFLSCEQ